MELFNLSSGNSLISVIVGGRLVNRISKQLIELAFLLKLFQLLRGEWCKQLFCFFCGTRMFRLHDYYLNVPLVHSGDCVVSKRDSYRC